ncbi:glycosyl hydrolase family 18 protein [Pseudoalteromonas luteoviolacea]|uniref:chitinase n=1 Tax=Pseudoalteromonas luteoviolacea (strain 2ta16) TaxID=1353533 RepID=V4GZE9_PSEL2|nr:glycosyl hydrolase family 18 protein [Pseudoalteromonas luteoviolacea]ESP90551.1 Chitinase [Pseudoalteromonas luteoviolacea 2ta16]KZN41878.1 hypothetical protein N483_14500 [Pseudoalteromonas luteoviolacea NCIMB 1944]
MSALLIRNYSVDGVYGSATCQDKTCKGILMKVYKLNSMGLFGLMLMSATHSSWAQEQYQEFTGNHQQFKQTSNKVVGTYIANWSDPNSIDDVPGDNLTHILYAFLRACGPGELPNDATVCANKPDYVLAEDDATIDKQFAPKFLQLKQKYPHLKILPSVGGWGGSDTFPPMAKDPQARQVFVQSVVNYLRTHRAFDGIDIDWEWPNTPEEGGHYADLMHDLRAAFDVLEAELGRKYSITSAIGTHANNVRNIDYERAAPYLDYIFLMTYDFFGGWSRNNIGHHTSLDAHSANMAASHGVMQGVQNLLNKSVPASKLVVGVAKYARGFDGISLSASGTPIGGQAAGLFPKAVQPWDEEGVGTYRRIVDEVIGPNGQGINGFTIRYDADCDCHYAWRESDAAFVGFDHPSSVIKKAQYVLNSNLGGIFAWEYAQDNGDILSAMNYGIGNQWLGNSNPGDGICRGIANWRAEDVYRKGDQVHIDNRLYEAKWYSNNQHPAQYSGRWQVWQFISACQ